MSTPSADLPTTHDVLQDASAGGRAIRGGAIRVTGYGAGMALTAVTSIALLRYLGVDDFGRYATVTALVAIVQGVTDAGLNVIGQREYVLRRTDAEKRALLSDILGIRLVLTPLGVLAATLFTLVAGYDWPMVAGTLLAGCGLVIANAAVSLTLPLSSTLRLGWVTAVDVARQAAIMMAILALVLAGAALAPFFAAHIAGGLAALAVTLAGLRGTGGVRARFAWAEWRPLLTAAAPVAVSLALNVIYLRVLLVMMSLMATEYETGLFATSFRVLEVFLGVPVLMVGSAFPILARAGADDEPRLAYALQRLAEASMLVSATLALGLAIAAEPIVRILGGDEYVESAPVLRLQCLVLLPAFLTQVWAFGLVSIHRQRAMVAISAISLATVLALGAVLIPTGGATGAAAAAVAGESALALSALAFLARDRPALRPQLWPVLRVALAAAPAVLVGLIPGLPPLISAALAMLVFTGLAFGLRAVPRELRDAFPRRARP